MYKFFGEPLKIIYSKTSNKPLFRFDTKGEFITDDEEIIKRALGFFDHIKMSAEIVGEKVTKTVSVPEMTITTVSEENKVNSKDNSKIEMTDEEVRIKAKEKGIKNWHNKKIENLLVELKEG